MRPQDIDHILSSIDYYNPSCAPILESYVATQLSSPKELYDQSANNCLLMMYQFHPTYASASVMAQILALALLRTPESDFTACLYLMTEQTITDPVVQRLIQLHNLLLECRYKEFWSTLYQDDVCAPVVQSIEGFTSVVRNVIADAIDMSFQAIRTSAVQSYMGVRDQNELESIMAERSWTFDQDAAIIKIPKNASNEAKSVTITENLRFDQVSKVLAYGA